MNLNSKLVNIIRDDEKVKCILIHVAISGGRIGIKKEAERYMNKINIKTQHININRKTLQYKYTSCGM